MDVWDARGSGSQIRLGSKFADLGVGFHLGLETRFRL